MVHDFRALVVDPGKMTGWGFLDVFPHPEDGQLEVEFRGGEMAHDPFIDWASTVISNGGALDPQGVPVGPIHLVIVEGFTITERTIQQAPDDRSMWSVKQVGILETFCRWWPTELRRQMPSDKAFGTDAMLKRVGWWDPMPGIKGEKGHRRDAGRHALKYVVDKQIIDLRRLLP